MALQIVVEVVHFSVLHPFHRAFICSPFEHLRQIERGTEGKTKRQIYIEPRLTLELAEPGLILHTVCRWGQRPNGAASKAAH